MKNRTSKTKNYFYNTNEKKETGGYYYEKMQYIERMIGSDPQKILDIGCHDGFFGKQLLKRGHSVSGVDISKRALEKAKNNGLKTYLVDIEQERLPFTANSFNVVILGDIIEHVFDTDALLQECYRVLAPYGKLIISTPNVASLGRRCMLFLGMSPYLEYSIHMTTNGLPSVGHIRYYTFKILENQLETRKLTVISKAGDVINIGSYQSHWLTHVFPTLSRQIFITAQKIVL